MRMWLFAGLALRLLIAYVIFPGSGFESDLSSYASWAQSMAAYGPGGFYENAGFADYPPAYLYVLWLVGSLSGAAVSATELIKLPPILLDIAVSYVIYRLVRGWTWPGLRSEALALAAAALYVFNPVSFYDSALWGQTDAAGALVVLLGLAALIRGNSEGAAAFAASSQSAFARSTSARARPARARIASSSRSRISASSQRWQPGRR